MATKLHGLLNLSRIDKRFLTTNKYGEKCVWVDVLERRDGADQYGNTHSITMYDKENGKALYLADLKPQEFGASAKPQPQQPADHKPLYEKAQESLEPQQNDLPF